MEIFSFLIISMFKRINMSLIKMNKYNPLYQFLSWSVLNSISGVFKCRALSPGPNHTLLVTVFLFKSCFCIFGYSYVHCCHRKSLMCCYFVFFSKNISCYTPDHISCILPQWDIFLFLGRDQHILDSPVSCVELT